MKHCSALLLRFLGSRLQFLSYFLTSRSTYCQFHLAMTSRRSQVAQRKGRDALQTSAFQAKFNFGCQKKGALQFLGRSIYRAQDGESSLYFGVSREYMVGIFESWGENIKAGHAGLMPKLGCSQRVCKEVW